MRIRSVLGFLAAAAVFPLLPACTTPGIHDAARVGPFFSPTNFRSEAAIRVVRRVVVMPVCAGGVAPEETEAMLDPIFIEALRRQNLFDVVTVSRAECQRRFGTESLASDAVLPPAVLTTLRADHGADAVLLVDLTSYSAYRPLTVGIRAKLIAGTPSAPETFWAFDEVFSAGNPKVANSARHYYLGRAGRDVPADMTLIALLSPRKFSAYVAAAVFATLPGPAAGEATVASADANPPLKFGRIPSIAAADPQRP